jgi:hypothetical protein
VTFADPKSPLGSEFDNFLFARIGEDQNGLTLSVVSLLARMNLDPWEQAGILATLPAQAAAKCLSRSLDSLTDPLLRQAIGETTVQRLLALLPRRMPAAVSEPLASLSAMVSPQPGARIRVIISIVFIAATIILVGVQMFATRRFAPSQPGIATAPPALSAPSQTPSTATHH